jgi:hypothetical protein
MDAGVAVALIAAATSLALGAFNAYWSWRQRNRERRIEAKAELSRYRKPLLEAAADLGARIDNIQHSNFDVYFESNERREIAVKSTLYRFARYFGTLEILRSQMSFLEFEDDRATREVAKLLLDIEGTMSSDDYRGFMLWREEQRAIGELALEREGDTLRCIGFATFVNQFDQHLGSWLEELETQLKETGTAAKSGRLKAVQSHLQKLVQKLDEEGRYEPLAQAPAWLRRS